MELVGIAGTVFSNNLSTSEVFRPDIWTLVRLELDCMCCRVQVGEVRLVGSTECIMLSGAKKLILTAHNGTVQCSAIEITHGWESLFMDNNLCEHGWEADNNGSWHIAETNELIGQIADGSETILSKYTEGLVDYELVVNFRLMEQHGKAVFYLGARPYEVSFALEADRVSKTIAILRKNGETVRSLPWPEAFDPYSYQQLRFTKIGTVFAVAIANTTLLEVPVPDSSLSRIALGITGSIAFDMVRLTEIIGEH